MGDTTREKWDTEKMREHRNDWSLAADIHLFSYMQQFSQNLLSETHTTLKAIDSLESDVATTCVEVSNIGNRFWALSDTQFVENRVYDDDDVTSPVAPSPSQITQKEDGEAVVIQRLQESILNGIQVLDSKFETVQVPASDSDEDDSSPHSGVILKPVNRYRERRLPHLIGSAEFRADDTLGLRDAPSDEETEDFRSASDKANESDSMEDSEDSDIESDQTKTQHVPIPKPSSNIFDPHNPRLPGLENVQANTFSVPSPSSEDMFGEQEDDLFTQMAHKKPLFRNWPQTSDLWATEEEDEKRLGDDSSNNRPPSANSSTSAQSSNVSEPTKKSSEDFGKSGTGRQAVRVQEDQDDLFGPKATGATVPQTKEFVPTGGVKIFGGDFNPFKNPLKENQNENVAPVVEQTRSEKSDIEGEIFTQKHDVPARVLPKVLPSNILPKKKEVSLFDDEEDDLFSNRSIESKPKSQTPSLSSSRISFGVNRNEPEDDDLFSNSSLFSESKTQLSHSLFKDDLFSDESEDLFSNIDSKKKQKSDKPTAVSKILGDSLFSDLEALDKYDGSQSNAPSEKPKTKNSSKDIFGDGDDLFGSISKPKGNDLFGEVPSAIKPPVGTSFSKEQPKIPASKPFKKDLFDESENDNDDLFGTSTKISKANQNTSVHHDSLFGSKTSSVLKTSKPEVQGDDLFGPSTRVSPDVKNLNVKVKQPILKPKKGLEKRSLFDSDSDDDLFSSPQGSLSSRKSVQSASGPAEPSVREDKKKFSKDSTIPRLPKTDFSSIFSNDQDEIANVTLDKKLDKSSTLFGEDADLFSSSNVNVKTPDLFNKSSKEITVGQIENSNQDPKLEESGLKVELEPEDNKMKTTVEAVNKNMVDTNEDKPSFSVPLKKDIFDDSPPGNEKEIPISKKPEPPKSLDVKPIVENLKNNPFETKEKGSDHIQKPPVSKKPSPKVNVEKPNPKDATDGEVISPVSPSKIPGKLKASQLISINTAALLPGARPSKSEPMLSSGSEPKVDPEPMTPLPDPTPLPRPPQTSVTSQDAPDMLPKSSLLQSVNKERVKIQGKRRPPSRRARQEAIRASSLDTGLDAGPRSDAEISSVPPATSALMSPSTDEEDLFGVPPLDVYGAKTVSPSTDIFGTPTVLSPIDNKELPSSFVSTPFVHSQPPPLDEEQEEGSNQEEDLFGSQSNLVSSLTKDKKQSMVEKEIQSKKEIMAEDIFGDVEDDGLFRGMREAPPPLVDDDDDDEYDELFMTRKKKENISSKISHSGSVIAALESLPREDSLFSRPSHSSLTPSYTPSIPPKKQDLEDDFIFSSKDSSSVNPDSLFSTLEKPNNAIDDDDSLFSKPSIHSTVVPGESLSSSTIETKKPSDGSLGISSLVKEVKEDSLFSHSAISDDKDSSLFTKSNSVSSELFSAPVEISSKVIPDKSEAKSNEDADVASDDELFGSHSKSATSNKKSLVPDISKATLTTVKERPTKKEALFGEDEEDEVGNLFSSVTEKKIKAKPPVKSSLFGDEDEDDDLFGSLSSSKKPEAKTTTSTSETVKGTTPKAAKAGSSGSSKPVKLETKQTFSDPLLSHGDKD